MAADQGLIDSIANENNKIGAGAPAHYAASAMQGHSALQNQVNAHLSRLNMIAETALQNGIAISQAATASAVKSLTELDAVEAMSTAVIGQQGANIAQTTPRETGKPA